jgi:hypothetical protein
MSPESKILVSFGKKRLKPTHLSFSAVVSPKASNSWSFPLTVRRGRLWTRWVCRLQCS